MVIDEYGSVTGMVTLFDVLESITGDIRDSELDLDAEVVSLSENAWSLDGMLPIDELKDLLGMMEIPGEDKAGYQTLSGLIMHQLGEIPSIGQGFIIEDYYFEVTDMDGLRVDRVAMTRMPPEDTEETA